MAGPFWTSYNTERAIGKLEVTSTQKDRDYIIAVNWKEAEKAANEGRGVKIIDGVKVIDPAPGIVYLPLQQESARRGCKS